MCVEVKVLSSDSEPPTFCTTIAELSAVMPHGLVVDPDYFTVPITNAEVLARSETCLCPIDCDATAEANGYEAWWDTTFDVDFRRPSHAG